MWEELGIAPTADVKIIRRAYATRLRGIDADREPIAFQRLRSAYEQALGRAARTGQRSLAPPAVSPELPPVHPSVAQPSVVSPPQPDPDAAEAKASADAVRVALGTGQYEEAFAAYDSGLARGSFSLYQRESTLEGIMRVIAADRAVSPSAFCYFMKRAGWQMFPASRQRISSVRSAANARMEAGLWFMRMRDLADGDEVPLPPHKRGGMLFLLVRFQQWLHCRMERRNARIFFGSWQFWKSSRASIEDLRRKAFQYRRHESWLKEHFEPKNIARANRILRWRDKWDEYAFSKWAGRYFAFLMLAIMISAILRLPVSAGMSIAFLGVFANRGYRWLKATLGLNG